MPHAESERADLAELADIVRVVAAQVPGFGAVRDRIDRLINKLIYPPHSDGSISGAGSGSQDPSDEAQQRPLRGSMPPPAPEHIDGFERFQATEGGPVTTNIDGDEVVR